MSHENTPIVQIALDCADPHRQARFWAAALGYEVEENEAQIRELLSAGMASDDDVTTFEGVLVWKTGAACSDPTGRRPRWYFQQVPEEKTVKNRMHVDVHVGPEGRDPLVAQLVELGASRLYEGQQGPHTWITMADPEGNEFCVA
jgi:hypothetical protein